jgi:hypothetical protein
MRLAEAKPESILEDKWKVTSYQKDKNIQEHSDQPVEMLHMSQEHNNIQ